MKAILNAVILYSLAARASAYWANSRFIVNGVVTDSWKYVLDVGDSSGYPATHRKGQEIMYGEQYTETIRCGYHAFESLGKTEIADVVAGEEVGFGTTSPYSDEYWRPGPGSAWLSRAPNDDLKSYHGDGDWFKIAYAGPKSNTEWELYRKTSYNFTIPKTTPPGKYLLRVEQFEPDIQIGNSKYFANCALVNIKGAGGGIPKGFAKFPGTYYPEDLGIWIPWNQTIGNIPDEHMALLDYKPPGPPVWEG